MATFQDEVEDNISQLLRTAAKHYGQAVTEYGNTLVAYGKGDVDANKVAEAALKLAGSEARRVLSTGVGLGTAYAKWAASAIGLKSLTREPQAPQKPKR